MKAITLIILSVSVWSCAERMDEDPALSTILTVGKKMPSFVYTTPDGVEKSSDDLKGKVILINFFATWCGPCIKELPYLQEKVYETIQDQEFVLLCLGREHNAEELNVFAEQKKLNLPFYPDPDRKIYSLFAEKFIPRNFLINREGTVIFEGTGFEKNEFDSMVKLIETELDH